MYSTCLCHQNLAVVGVREADIKFHQLADHPAMLEKQKDHLKKKRPSRKIDAMGVLDRWGQGRGWGRVRLG